MKNLKRKKFIDFRENFQKKTKLIEDLKILISNELNLKEKEDIFNSIRKKWNRLEVLMQESYQSTN